MGLVVAPPLLELMESHPARTGAQVTDGNGTAALVTARAPARVTWKVGTCLCEVDFRVAALAARMAAEFVCRARVRWLVWRWEAVPRDVTPTDAPAVIAVAPFTATSEPSTRPPEATRKAARWARGWLRGRPLSLPKMVRSSRSRITAPPVPWNPAFRTD